VSITAKPVLKDKFWIVENKGVRIGTLSKNEEGYVINEKGSINMFKTENALKRKYGKSFLTATITDTTNNEDTVLAVHGYPTRSKPYNSMFDIKNKLPLFTKSKKSKSVYCAGYYLIKFNVNWLKSFCPKVITIERNEYVGPFRTELEMKVALSNANRAN